MSFTREDKENRKFEEDPSDSAKVVVKTKVENQSSDPVPVEIVNADSAVDIQVEIPGTITATIDDSTPIDVNVTDASINTNATIQNASIPVTAASTLNVSVQNAFQYIYSKLYDGSSWQNQSSDTSGRAIVKQQKYYSTADITALGSSTSIVTWVNAFVDGVLVKEYTSSFSGSNKIITYYTHPNLGDGDKCIRVVNTYHSGGGVETSFPTVQDWTYDSFATPAAAVALGSITHPALDAAAGTDVCTITPSGGPAGCTYVLTLTGTDASLYQINNTTTGTTPGASVAASLGDSIVLETASTFAYTTTGYSHGPMTITNTEQTNDQTASATASTARVVPATLSLGTITSPDNDAAAGTDVCTITPGGGPSSPVQSTYTISLSGTDASLYQVNNTTTATTGASVAASLGDSIVLETVALFEYEATGYSHSLTVTNTESINSQTASSAVATTQDADAPSFTNNKYVDMGSLHTGQRIKMGVQSDWNDSDSFFFRRRSDKWTISWWMKMPSSSSVYGQSSNAHQHEKVVFGTSDGTRNEGIRCTFRQSHFRVAYYQDGNNAGVSYTGDVISWQDGNWHHYAVTYDGPGLVSAGASSLGSYLKIYRDGSLVSITGGDFGTWLASEAVDTGNTVGTFNFGHNYGSSWYSNVLNKTASYDEIAIWKTDLSAGNITTIYNSGTPNDVSGIESSNLKRYYRLENLKGWELSTESTNQYINMGVKADFDNSGDAFWFRRRSDSYTISWWMKFPSSSADYTDGSYANHSFIYSVTGSTSWKGTWASFKGNKLELWVYNGSGNGGQVYTGDVTSWQDGNWHHYAVTYDGPGLVSAGAASLGTYLKLYRDGSAVPTTTVNNGTWLSDETPETGNTTGHFRFGYPDNRWYSHVNEIASYKETAIWKTDLSSAQITTLYNSGVPYGDDTTSLEASNLKRFYKGDTTDAAGNFTAVVGSDVELISEDTKGNFDGTLGTATTIEDY